MARFYATIQGARSEASRQGTAQPGMIGHVRGWNVGAEVECSVGADGEDEVRVYRTGGSHGRRGKLIATLRADDA